MSADLTKIYRSQLTLLSAKIAAESMTNILSAFGLSILGACFVLGELKVKNLKQIFSARDDSTIAHTVTDLTRRGFVIERFTNKYNRYIRISAAGAAIWSTYVAAAADYSEKINMLKTQIENNRPPC